MSLLGYIARFWIAGVVLLVITLPVFADSMPLPPGWRMPTSSELNDDWRGNDPDNYSIIRGDFNGDGNIDQAMLLVSLRGRGIGIFVFLSQKNHTFRSYSINVMKDIAFLRAMGIAKVLPGQYKTACGKGYWECAKNEVPEISIKHDAIEYFKTESASSYFYWDEQRRIFKRIWISD